MLLALAFLVACKSSKELTKVEESTKAESNESAGAVTKASLLDQSTSGWSRRSWTFHPPAAAPVQVVTGTPGKDGRDGKDGAPGKAVFVPVPATYTEEQGTVQNNIRSEKSDSIWESRFSKLEAALAAKSVDKETQVLSWWHIVLIVLATSLGKDTLLAAFKLIKRRFWL